MKNLKKKSEVFQLVCPCCGSLLWIDPVTQEVIQFEKRGKKKKGSLDDLLLKEKKKKDEFDRKFQATAELEKKKWQEAQEKFKKALSRLDKKD